jgi:hypothetical protein
MMRVDPMAVCIVTAPMREAGLDTLATFPMMLASRPSGWTCLMVRARAAFSAGTNAMNRPSLEI